MRTGFRNTSVFGALLLVLASLGFLLLPYPGSVWALILDQIVLGAGCGLISTPLLVGVQSAVGWQQRGVVTGANMFARYLGQSLGAALCGAIFNAEIMQRLTRAPEALQSRLPTDVSDVVNALQTRHGGGTVTQYLQHAVFAATGHIYAGMLVVALLTLVVILCMPRNMPKLAGSEAEAEAQS